MVGPDEGICNPAHLPSVVEVSRDVYSLVWQLGSKNSEWMVDVDSARGFTPIHAVMRQRKKETDPWQIVQEVKTDWKSHNAVWVPTHFEIDQRREPKISTRRLTMDLLWSAVNGEIPDTVFSDQSLGAPDAVAVVDSRLGTPVTIKESGRTWTTDVRPEPKRSSRVGTLLIVNTIRHYLASVPIRG